LHRPPYLKDVAALPSETIIFQKSYKFKNTVPKDVRLKYFCGCIYWISFCLQIRVSTKNYELSVRINSSVHEPQWRNKREIRWPQRFHLWQL